MLDERLRQQFVIYAITVHLSVLLWRSKFPAATQRKCKELQIQPAETRDMPYCPICKAEYRTGFARCCHCLALLVGSSREADAERVVLLWEGLSRDKFEALVAALHDANIPNRARCGADPGAAYIFNLRGRRLLKGMKKTSWQVSVLEADYERAQNVARSCL